MTYTTLEKKKTPILCESYHFNTIGAYLYVELFKGLEQHYLPIKCGHCGRYFLLKSGKFPQYCTRPIKENEDKVCVNETYMRAWESIPPKRPSALSAYLGRITRNLALNRIRFFKSEKRGGGEADLSFDELDEFVSGEYSIEVETERKEFIAAINGFLDKLPVRQQQLFVERYWGCCNLAEIAARHGMSQSVVSESLAGTCKKLKKYLLKRGFEI